MSPLPTSLAYSLGQAGMIWGMLQVLNLLIPAARCRLRHGLALGALLLVVAAWGATWWLQGWTPEMPKAEQTTTHPASLQREVAAVQAGTITLETKEAAPMSWPQVVVVLWQVGVALGFVRMAWSVRLAQRIRAASVEVTEAAWKSALKELGERMGQRMAIGLRASAKVAGPIMMGMLRPTIILPTSALTGVPPEVLKATLAHEIAHVVRWDYVVNLVQMGIETALFFNPFVWLISQAVRKEREACCDQLASEICENTVAYAEMLMWWGGRDTPQTAAAMAISGTPSTLRERIRRLLFPQEAPLGDRTGWLGAFGLAALVPLFLILSALVVHAAYSEFTPQQRVALIARLTEPFRQSNDQREMPPGERQIYSGTVVDDKGQPVANARWMLISARQIDPVSGTIGPDAKYSVEGPRGLTTLVVRAPGHAPAVACYMDGSSRENATIVLSQGHDFRLQCVDKEGSPITGVEVKAESSEIPYWSSHATTGLDGWATLTHLPDLHRGNLTFDAANFQTARRSDTKLSDEKLSEPICLARIKPALIRVEDEITGEPVPGVRLRICGVQPQGASFTYPKWAASGIVTDQDGLARLDSLNPELSYDMMAEGTKRATTFQFNPRDGMSRTIHLPRERVLNLKFQHFPNGPITFQYSQNETENSSSARSATVNVVNGEAQASLNGLMPKPVDLNVLKQWVKAPELRTEMTELVIDYDKIKPSPAVHIVVKAKMGRGQAPPAGAYGVNWAPTENAGVWNGLSVPIRNGVAEFELPQGSFFELRNGELLGGKVEESRRYQARTNPTEIEAPVTPAGVIRVKLLEPDGRLASNTFIEARNIAKPEAQRIEIKNGAFACDAREWFISEPVELGSSKYHVLANASVRYAVSPPFKVDASNPIQDVVLTLPKAQTRSVRVVDRGGNALGGVTLKLSVEVPATGRLSGLSVTTDANGIARIETGENASGRIWVQPMSEVLVPALLLVEFPPTGAAQIVAEKGKTLKGRLIDHSTGGGVEQCRVAWMLSSANMSSQQQVVGPKGTFEFDNVPDQKVFLSMSIPRGKKIGGPTEIRPGEREVILELFDDEASK